MLKLTKTAIGLLTKQYRSVLRKCLLLNLGICLSIMNFQPAIALTETKTVIIGEDASATGDYAVAIGHRAKSKSWSVAIGSDARIYSSEGIAIGDGATVRGNSSIALGRDSVATDDSVVSVGHSVGDLLYNDRIATSDLFRRIVNVAEGINAHDAVTLGQMNDALNYYYTFRGDKRDEVIDSASFFQKDFSTLQEVDLHIKNPTHLGAFTKCDEACPRSSERFVSSLSQEQMFKNNASVDAGTSRHCLRQFGDVVADLLKNTAAKSLRISEFMNEEV